MLKVCLVSGPAIQLSSLCTLQHKWAGHRWKYGRVLDLACELHCISSTSQDVCICPWWRYAWDLPCSPGLVLFPCTWAWFQFFPSKDKSISPGEGCTWAFGLRQGSFEAKLGPLDRAGARVAVRWTFGLHWRVILISGYHGLLEYLSNEGILGPSTLAVAWPF